tara:strand:- start:336 stop:530 length:195 start_codon:yes stop_codon:yes gene_type:complete
MESRQFRRSAISPAERIKRDIAMRRQEPVAATPPAEEKPVVVDESDGPWWFESLDEAASPEWNC